jgi:hypothetical protein
MDDGTTREIADVNFAENTTITPYAGDAPISAAAAALPDLQGYGSLMNLRPAMTQDPQLLAMVQNLLTTDPTDTAAFDSAFEQVMFRWAGIDGVDPTSRGPDIDAQKLGFLEDFLGTTWDNGAPDLNPIYGHQGAYLIRAFDSVFGGLEARFLKIRTRRSRPSSRSMPQTAFSRSLIWGRP